MGDLSNKDKGEFTIADPDNNDYELHVSSIGGASTHIIDPVTVANKLAVNPDGSINTKDVIITPPGSTSVSAGGLVTVTKLGGTNDFNYVIPSGETLSIQFISFGGYIPANTDNPLNAKVDYYNRPNGTTVGQIYLGSMFLQHTAFVREEISPDVTFLGDGTISIGIAITNWSKDDVEFDRRIKGYY